MLDRYKDRYQKDIKIDTGYIERQILDIQRDRNYTYIQKDRYLIYRKIDTRYIERQILDIQKDRYQIDR